MKQLDKIKAHLKRNKDFYLVGGAAAVAGAVASSALSRASEKKTAVEPERLADAQHIVLENVNGQNLWFDLDEPDNFYRLEGLA